METTKPASPTLQGIPLELRTKIYTYLAINEPRDVSGHQFVKMSRESQSSSSGDLWKQFQSAITPHPLTLTCRQMFSEFNHVLLTTSGQTYNLIVNNLDLEQLALFHRFVRAHCSSHRITETMSQPLPLLFKDVTLSLHLDGDVLQSIEAYIEGLKTALPYRHRGAFDALSEVKILPGNSSGVSGDRVTNETESLTESQVTSARFAMHRICFFHGFFGLDMKVVELMHAHFAGMADSH